MNLQAARKAMTRAAYEHALKYSVAARELSEQLTKKVDQSTRLGINQVLVLALYSLARYDDALNESETIIKTTQNQLERIVIGVERVRALRSLGRNNEAYEHGMKAIQEFGLRVPDEIYDPSQIMSLCSWYGEFLNTEKTIRVLCLKILKVILAS